MHLNRNWLIYYYIFFWFAIQKRAVKNKIHKNRACGLRPETELNLEES